MSEIKSKNTDAKEKNKILVVGPAWVGDMVMAQSLFKTLKKHNADSIIDVLAPPWSLPILSRMPEVNKGISLPVKHKQLGLKIRYRIGRQLRKNQYQQAIVLPRSFKAALVPFFAKIPLRTGYRGEFRLGLINDTKVLDKSILKQTVQRFTALGYKDKLNEAPAINQPCLMVDKANLERFINDVKLKMDKPVIAFMPGAEYGDAKCWPKEYYRQLAEMLVNKGFRIWILGTDKDLETALFISEGYQEDVINLCGKTKLEDVVDILSTVKMAVTNDSGLMHVACAVGIKLVCIYGSSTPDYTPPLSERAEVIYLNKSCSPCFQRTCQFEHLECLRDIKPIDVFEHIN